MAKEKNFKNMADEELQTLRQDLLRELYHLRSARRTGQRLEKPHELREKRKDIARILTVLRERQLTTAV